MCGLVTLAVISHQVLTALNRLALPERVLTARPKRLPFLLFHMPADWCATRGVCYCVAFQAF